MAQIMYGVVESKNAPNLSSKGLSGAPVRLLPVGRICVAVSELIDSDLLPRRRNLSDFQRVISDLTLQADVLPMSFGMVADDADDIQEILGGQVETLLQRLHLIAGKTEYSLRVTWKGDSVFSHFVETEPKLCALRDQYFEGGRCANQQEKLRLGQTFERLLQERRNSTARRLVDGLRPVLKEHAELPISSENCFANLAILIDRQRTAGMDSLIETLASEFHDEIVFEVTGPWPPYSFANLKLD